LFGDTRHTADQSYNIESGAAGNGLFPREGQQLSDLNRFADVLQSWCASTDPICAEDMGPTVVETHLNYFDIYSNSAGEWVREMVSGGGNSTSRTVTSSSSASSSSSATRTSSSSATEQTASSTANEASTTGADTTPSASSTEEAASGADMPRAHFAAAVVAIFGLYMI
jgi:hypothetical protein